MAVRRHLRGLPALLRRRRRRRRGRPRRAHRPAAVHRLPRRRRHLDDPVPALPAGGPGLRRDRLLRRGPAVRHHGTVRVAPGEGPRAGPADPARRRPQPLLLGAPAVPGGPRGRPGLAGAGHVPLCAGSGGHVRRRRRGSASDAAGRRLQPTTSRRTTGRASSAAGPGAAPTPSSATDTDWYLHLFSAGQPDWNWRNPAVGDYFDGVLRFWFDKGVDGLRIDVAHALFKADGLPDSPSTGGVVDGLRSNPQVSDQEDVHEVYRRWRTLAEKYEPHRLLVGEVNLEPARAARYTRADEMQQAFAFAFVKLGWDPEAWAAVGNELEAARQLHGAAPTWALENHDIVRSVTRFGGGELGSVRARAALVALLGLPGAAYIYQGQELGLPEVDVPVEARVDPMWARGGVCRDGARVPLPWTEDAALNHGFSLGEPAADPWLPIPAGWGTHADRAAGAGPGVRPEPDQGGAGAAPAVVEERGLHRGRRRQLAGRGRKPPHLRTQRALPRRRRDGHRAGAAARPAPCCSAPRRWPRTAGCSRTTRPGCCGTEAIASAPPARCMDLEARSGLSWLWCSTPSPRTLPRAAGQRPMGSSGLVIANRAVMAPGAARQSPRLLCRGLCVFPVSVT